MQNILSNNGITIERRESLDKGSESINSGKTIVQVYFEDCLDIPDRIHNALDCQEYETAKEELKKYSIEHPANWDIAYHLACSYYYLDRVKEAHQITEYIIQQNEILLSNLNFNAKQDVLLWYCLPNRILLRTYHLSGLMHLEANNFSKATARFNRLVCLDRNDPMGARIILGDIYLLNGNLKKIVTLANKYKDGAGTELLIAKYFALYQLDFIDRANDIIESLLEYKSYYIEELSKVVHKPPQPAGDSREERYNFDLQSEAYGYWQNNSYIFDVYPHALENIREKYRTKWQSIVQTNRERQANWRTTYIHEIV